MLSVVPVFQFDYFVQIKKWLCRYSYKVSRKKKLKCNVVKFFTSLLISSSMSHLLCLLCHWHARSSVGSLWCQVSWCLHCCKTMLTHMYSMYKEFTLASRQARTQVLGAHTCMWRAFCTCMHKCVLAHIDCRFYDVFSLFATWSIIPTAIRYIRETFPPNNWRRGCVCACVWVREGRRIEIWGGKCHVILVCLRIITRLKTIPTVSPLVYIQFCHFLFHLSVKHEKSKRDYIKAASSLSRVHACFASR